MTLKRSSLVLLAIAIGVSLSACGSSGSNRDTAYTAPKGASASVGGFSLQLRHAGQPSDRRAYRLMRDSSVLGNVVSGMNSTYRLPHEIKVVALSANIPSPAYIPSKRALFINYGFINFVAQTLLQAYPNITEADLEHRVQQVTSFVLLHEMGHALIDQLHIPVTAKEEDAVDNLATVINVDAINGGDQAVVEFADFFDLLQKSPNSLTSNDFWDVHSLDAQRAADAICLVYGSDPKGNSVLAQYIPAERRSSCPHEWQQISSSWQRLLKPYTK